LNFTKAVASLAFFFSTLPGKAQPVPSVEENIPFLVTFSKGAEKNWGDDDFVQLFFFAVPESRKDPVYIRVCDPDVGGKNDEDRGGFNSKTAFSVYGGKGAHSDPDAKKTNPEGKFKSGVLLSSKTFSADAQYDDKWYTFGPFNPAEGELQPEFGGYVFKLVVEGTDGDDGNTYKVFLSSKSDQNSVIEGGNGFTYEYCFRTNEKTGSVSHLYPFIGKNVISIKINTFDYDTDGIIRMISVVKKSEMAGISGDGVWSASTHKIVDAEINTSVDIQIIKKTGEKNNNVVIFITNQFGEAMPFFTIPIGGAPKFKPTIVVKPRDK
jgi:hypothetical protein